MTETYELWISSIPGIYRKNQANLRNLFGSAKRVFEAPKKEIMQIPFLKEKQKEELLHTRELYEPEKLRHALHEKGIRFISWRDDEYPQRLKEISDFPYGIFLKGRLPKNEEKMAAIVGARLCSPYGRHFSEQIAEALAKNGVGVVSGMARGVDCAAQKKAVESGGYSLAVLGCGVDICYPTQNRRLYQELEKRGGILSEYPPGTPPLPLHFPMRNRIISGLSEIVIITEAKEKSGSLITADMALEQGRDVMALPGRITDTLSQGCNRLIAQGAGMFQSENELLERLLGGNFTKILQTNLNLSLESEEKLVYSVLEFQTLNLQTILDRTGMPVAKVLETLVKLQMKGYIRETARNYYEKV